MKACVGGRWGLPGLPGLPRRVWVLAEKHRAAGAARTMMGVTGVECLACGAAVAEWVERGREEIGSKPRPNHVPTPSQSRPNHVPTASQPRPEAVPNGDASGRNCARGQGKEAKGRRGEEGTGMSDEATKARSDEGKEHAGRDGGSLGMGHSGAFWVTGSGRRTRRRAQGRGAEGGSGKAKQRHHGPSLCSRWTAASYRRPRSTREMMLIDL